MDLLARAYSRFLIDSDVDEFLTAIVAHGGIAPNTESDYPIAHRIRDIPLEGNDYRIVRVYDIETRGSKLFIYPTAYLSTQLGVPFELSGEGIHKWVLDELTEPSDEDVDWERYLGMS